MCMQERAEALQSAARMLSEGVEQARQQACMYSVVVDRSILVGGTRRLAWALRCPCYEWHMTSASQLFGGMAQMLCLDHPWLQVVTNNRRVFQRIARTFAELAQCLVPGHTFALRSSAGGPHKVVKQSLL